jgi:hypothetical protein
MEPFGTGLMQGAARAACGASDLVTQILKGSRWYLPLDRGAYHPEDHLATTERQAFLASARVLVVPR